MLAALGKHVLGPEDSMLAQSCKHATHAGAWIREAPGIFRDAGLLHFGRVPARYAVISDVQRQKPGISENAGLRTEWVSPRRLTLIVRSTYRL